MGLKYLVYMTDKKRAENLMRLLKHADLNEVFICPTLASTINFHKKNRVHCVIFERDLAFDFARLMQLFHDPYLWFVPVDTARNDLDIIDAINTHHSAYYLIEPITQEEISSMNKCLKWRINDTARRSRLSYGEVGSQMSFSQKA